MGWASGTSVAIPVIESIKKHVTDPKVRRKLYKDFLDAMDNADWDTQDEAMDIDPIFDKLVLER
jgi:hypothetical protein